MTDLERLEEAWPLGWKESTDWEGWSIKAGEAEVTAAIALDGGWRFFFDDDDESKLIGEGAFDTAVDAAVENMRQRADALRKRERALRKTVQVYRQRLNAEAAAKE